MYEQISAVKTSWCGDMNSHWGTEKRLVIVGSLVHNRRVERFNQDLNVNISQVFGPRLRELEGVGFLDIDNETDMFFLHYVLLPRVERVVREFAQAHNNHTICTEGNLRGCLCKNGLIKISLKTDFA